MKIKEGAYYLSKGFWDTRHGRSCFIRSIFGPIMPWTPVGTQRPPYYFCHPGHDAPTWDENGAHLGYRLGDERSSLVTEVPKIKGWIPTGQVVDDPSSHGAWLSIFGNDEIGKLNDLVSGQKKVGSNQEKSSLASINWTSPQFIILEKDEQEPTMSSIWEMI